jgi:1-deoxy-D-xylulose-5-phosphate synthase
MPMGSEVERGLSGAKAAMREMWEPPAFFETLGVRYTGPFDGHDIAGMEVALRNAAIHDGPIVVHVLTEKGRGYRPAEEHRESHLHDSGGFDLAVGPTAPAGQAPEYKQAFVEALLAAGEEREDLVAITAAMPGSTGVLRFQERFPDRAFDVGIAEQHAVTGAAGMAMGGLRPVVAIYSTFLNRAWDQVVYDVALHRLPVILCIDRAGITGPDGASHHGVYDMALLAKVPGMRVLAPSSAQELAQMLHDAVSLADEGPVAIRYPRAAARQVGEHEVGRGLAARLVVRGEGTCIIAVGRMLETAEDAAAALAAEGRSVTVWDARCCAPLDDEMIADAAGHERVITIEDGVRNGGIGMTVADRICALDPSTPVDVLGLPTKFMPHDPKPSHIHARFDLDAQTLAELVRGATRRG